jgi:serine/threonine protein kinase
LKNLIFKLLEKNPEQRLGAGEKDSEDILAHPYFEDINVTDYLSLKIKVPYKPTMGKGK